MVFETLKEKLLKILGKDCKLYLDIDTDWMTIFTNYDFFTRTQLRNIEVLLNDNGYSIAFIGHGEGMYIESYQDESLKGTDD